MSRRSVFCVTSGFLFGVCSAPKPSLAGTANPAFVDEVNFEPSQQARGDKIDINNAFVVRYIVQFLAGAVAQLNLPLITRTTLPCSNYTTSMQVDYKQFPGMYPTAAGKIASHGPYKSVKVRSKLTWILTCIEDG